MSPTLPPPPAGGPATREIPLADPAGAATATTGSPRATGPVPYVPGPPAGAPPAPSTATAVLAATSATPAGGPPPVPPAAQAARAFVLDLTDEPRAARTRRGGMRAGALLLAAVAAVVLEIGLLAPVGTQTLWSRVPLWAAFATVTCLAALAGVAARVTGRQQGRAPRVTTAGLGGLAAFWLLVVLPTADTDRGFLLTAGLAGLVAAVRAATRSGEPGVVEATREG